jgi:hypothetical protein
MSLHCPLITKGIVVKEPVASSPASSPRDLTVAVWDLLGSLALSEHLAGKAHLFSFFFSLFGRRKTFKKAIAVPVS